MSTRPAELHFLRREVLGTNHSTNEEIVKRGRATWGIPGSGLLLALLRRRWDFAVWEHHLRIDVLRGRDAVNFCGVERIHKPQNARIHSGCAECRSMGIRAWTDRITRKQVIQVKNGENRIENRESVCMKRVGTDGILRQSPRGLSVRTQPWERAQSERRQSGADAHDERGVSVRGTIRYCHNESIPGSIASE